MTVEQEPQTRSMYFSTISVLLCGVGDGMHAQLRDKLLSLNIARTIDCDDPTCVMEVLQRLAPEVAYLPADRFSPGLVEELCEHSPEVAFIVFSDQADLVMAESYFAHGCVDFVASSESAMRIGISLLKAAYRGSACEDDSDAEEEQSPSREYASSLHELHRLPRLKEATALLVEEAIRRAAGNKSEAGRLLGISPQAIWNRLHRSASNPDCGGEAADGDWTG